MRRLSIMPAGLLLCALGSLASAALPPPTPRQAQQQADKKAQADALAANEKQALLASMDRLSTRWRARAAAKGWKVNPPTTVASPGAAVNAPAQAAGPAAPPMPARSEKAGTAAPSEDIKRAPSPPASANKEKP